MHFSFQPFILSKSFLHFFITPPLPHSSPFTSAHFLHTSSQLLPHFLAALLSLPQRLSPSTHSHFSFAFTSSQLLPLFLRSLPSFVQNYFLIVLSSLPQSTSFSLCTTLPHFVTVLSTLSVSTSSWTIPQFIMALPSIFHISVLTSS